MALYDRSKVAGFYTAIAHEQNTCHYCERAIVKRREDKELSHDEMLRELKLLRGHLTGKRVMKFTYVGHEFCICPECLVKVNEELEVEVKKNPVTTQELDEPKAEDKTEDKTDEKQEVKSKSKGKANANK